MNRQSASLRAAPWTAPAAPAHLQRKCASCRDKAGVSGTCDSCEKDNRFGQAALQTKPNVLQREPDEKKKLPPPILETPYPLTPLEEDFTPKTDGEELAEGGGAVIKAFLKTETGKAVTDKLTSEAFATPLRSAATLGAVGGGIAGLALTGKELPFQLPPVPLGIFNPRWEGFSLGVIWNGPVNSPTEAALVFSFEAPSAKKGGPSFAEETARIAADQRRWRDGMTEQGGASGLRPGSVFAPLNVPGLPLPAAPEATQAPAVNPLQLTTPRLFDPALPPGLVYSPLTPLLLGEGLKLELPKDLLPKAEDAPVQKKLSIGSSPDPLEAEADRVADQVLAQPVAGSIAPQIQRFAPQATGEADAVPESVHRTLSGSGAPLEAGVRQSMEARFGQDFGAVRVHTDTPAARSASDVSALAYTVGSDIVFGAGQYAPGSASGQRLLAHELTHVVQQGGGQAQATVQRAGMGDVRLAEAGYCSKSFTIADDIHAAIDAAWQKSSHGGDTVIEQGGRIVSDKNGDQQIRTGSGKSGQMNLPDEKAGDRTTGTFHTHPYSKAEGSHLGVAFSAGDIENFIVGDQGAVKYIGAGSCYFVLDTVNSTARDKCKTEKIKERWDKAYAKASGTMSHKVEASVSAAIAGCGLCFYKACQPDAKSPVPKVATAV